MLLPDHDGSIHGDLSPERVRALCDRRAGIGGDGVLRVVREGDGWFMDYRNSDGSLSEMCGNGIRVFALHLAQEGLVDPTQPVPIGTRDGVKVLTFDGDLITADMGTPKVLGETTVSVGSASWHGAARRHGQPARGGVRVLAGRRRAARSSQPAYDAGLYPRRREHRVRGAPRRRARRDAGARARLRRDPLLRHRRLRGDGRGGARRRRAPATRRTASTCRAAPSRSPGPPTTGCCSPGLPRSWRGGPPRSELSGRPGSGDLGRVCGRRTRPSPPLGPPGPSGAVTYAPAFADAETDR